MQTAGKVATGLGVGLGVLLAVWWVRHRAAVNVAGRLLAGPDGMGFTFPSWVTGAKPSSSTSELALAANRQVARALAGTPLSDYRKAEDLQLFWNTAEDETGAYWKSAFWMAVASRIAKDGALARAASARAIKGNALGALPGGSLKKAGIAGIFSDAAKRISQAAKGNRQLVAISGTLAHFSDPALIATWKQGIEEQSTVGILKGTIAASTEDTVSILAVIRGIFTGEQPKGMDAARWWRLKWGLRAGIVATGGIALYLYASPKVRKVASVASSLGAAGRDFATKAKAALTDKAAA